MSATMVTDEIYDTFRADGELTRTFHHGTTFCGNPITSAVALAALKVYEEEQVIERLAGPASILEDGMGRLAVLLEDSPMQALGMIAAVEIKDSAGGAARAPCSGSTRLLNSASTSVPWGPRLTCGLRST